MHGAQFKSTNICTGHISIPWWTILSPPMMGQKCRVDKFKSTNKCTYYMPIKADKVKYQLLPCPFACMLRHRRTAGAIGVGLSFILEAGACHLPQALKLPVTLNKQGGTMMHQVDSSISHIDMSTGDSICIASLCCGCLMVQPCL